MIYLPEAERPPGLFCFTVDFLSKKEYNIEVKIHFTKKESEIMRKKTICLLLVLVMLLLSVSGCGKSVKYSEHLEDYVEKMTYRDGFTILQLTDIHWSNGTQIGDDNYGQREYLKKLVAEAVSHAGKVDLIEVTGDTFMLSNKAAVKSFIEFMEELGIPYAMTWGNHDRQGQYNPNWISKQFMNAEHCIYIEIDNDDVHERANYVIDLVDDAGKTVWQIFNLDSGASYRKGATDLGLTYDYIREDQYAWMKAEHDAAGADIPSLCYYHIAQMDTVEAYEKITAGDSSYTSKFFKLESFANSKYALSTTETFVACNVKGAFMGHCHANDFTYTTPEGIVYGFGVKTGLELYRGIVEAGCEGAGFEVTEGFDLTGASLVTIKDTAGSFELEHLYLNERDGGDFVMWVKY